MRIAALALLTLLSSATAEAGVSDSHRDRVAQPTRASCAPGATTILEYGEVSPKVFGVYTAREDAAGVRQLCLLVLFRGETNWHKHRAAVIDALRKRGNRTGGSNTSFPMITYSEDLGDLSLSFNYDWEHHRADIQGQPIDLAESNVVLVDFVDGVGGKPAVVRKLRVEPNLPSTVSDVRALVERVPAIRTLME